MTDDGPDRTVCWICQQPLERDRAKRYRGELVHADCRLGLPRRRPTTDSALSRGVGR